MTPKEKAIELVNKFESTIILNSWCDENTTEKEINRLVKKTALIAVDEMINFFINLSNEGFTFYSSIEYWQEIKTEIEKL
jgi:hypothetical protein